MGRERFSRLGSNRDEGRPGGITVSVVQLKTAVKVLAVVAGVGLCVGFAAHRRGWLRIPNRGLWALWRGAHPRALSVGEATQPFAGSYIGIEANGSGKLALEGTVLLAMNLSGETTGAYFDSSHVAHGFLRTASGSITEFDAPHASDAPTANSSTWNMGTIPIAVNASGDITGAYFDANHSFHGFTRSESGTYAEFDVPGAISESDPFLAGTWPTAINAGGEVAGVFSSNSTQFGGFFRTSGGSISTFVVGASNGWTIPTGMNDAGAITGTYMDSQDVYHGFVRNPDGALTEFNAPGASSSNAVLTGTIPIAINASGEITGTYTDANSVRHGFLRTADGNITEFTVPGAGGSNSSNPFTWYAFGGTAGTSIDSTGRIVGLYTDTNLVFHGFVRQTDGTIETLTAPGAGKGMFQGTAVFGTDSSGNIAGTYADANLVGHGFVFTPAKNATTTSLSSSPNPSFYGEPVTFTSDVSSDDDTPPNGEIVSFRQKATLLGSGTLIDGKASFKTSKLAVGEDSITAVYAGDTQFAGSKSIAVVQEVGKANAMVVLSAKPSSSKYGQTVNLTATVAPQFSGTPTGSVAFFAGTTMLGSVALSKGAARLSTTALAVGADALIAAYSGDQNFAPKRSHALNQNVAKAASTAKLSSSANPAGAGRSITFTVRVEAEYSGTPTGNVTFKDGDTVLKTIALTGGVVKYTTSTLKAGNHSISAEYSGSADFTSSVATLIEVID
jgi:hypothetical protein